MSVGPTYSVRITMDDGKGSITTIEKNGREFENLVWMAIESAAKVRDPSANALEELAEIILMYDSWSQKERSKQEKQLIDSAEALVQAIAESKTE